MNRLVTTVCNILISLVNVRGKLGLLLNYLESGKDDTQNGKEESGVGEAHLTSGGHSSTNDERNEREVRHCAICSAIPNTENDNGKDGGQHAHRLVERNRHHGQRQVGDGDVGGK